jgi:hypothetical protein
MSSDDPRRPSEFANELPMAQWTSGRSMLGCGQRSRARSNGGNGSISDTQFSRLADAYLIDYLNNRNFSHDGRGWFNRLFTVVAAASP